MDDNTVNISREAPQSYHAALHGSSNKKRIRPKHARIDAADTRHEENNDDGPKRKAGEGQAQSHLRPQPQQQPQVKYQPQNLGSLGQSTKRRKEEIQDDLESIGTDNGKNRQGHISVGRRAIPFLLTCQIDNGDQHEDRATTCVRYGMNIGDCTCIRRFVDQSEFQSLYDDFQAIYIPNVLGGDRRKRRVSTSSEWSNRENRDDTFRSNYHAASGSGDVKEPVCEDVDGKDNSARLSSLFTWQEMANLFSSLSERDRQSWCIEYAHALPSNGANKNESGNNDVMHPCNEKTEKQDSQNDDPIVFLSPLPTMGGAGTNGVDRRRGYCSFLIQHDKDMLRETLSRLPLEHLPIEASVKLEKPLVSVAERNISDNRKGVMQMRYGPCLWFFFGRNPSLHPNVSKVNENSSISLLPGRPEHTDSVSHDGTWHYQLSGRKIWYLRPTAQLVKRAKERENNELKKWYRNNDCCDGKPDVDDDDKEDDSASEVIAVECSEGDILIVNTRLWWHRTAIPQTVLSTTEGDDSVKVGPCIIPSVSYARDVYFPSSWKTGNNNETEGNDVTGSKAGSILEGEGGEGEMNTTMTNVDGIYAAKDIDERTVIFTEKEMPDGELHRSSKETKAINCEVVELEDGTQAVISTRAISAGEFLCIEETDDEEEFENHEEGHDSDKSHCEEDWASDEADGIRGG